MAIGVDARTPGSQSFAAGASVVGATTATWTHALGAALSNGFLIVDGAQDAGANSTSVVWDFGGVAQALTRKGTVTTGSCRAEIWGVANPAPSGSKSIQVAWSGAHDGCFASASYSGVDQVTPYNAASPQTNTAASGTSIALAVTTTSGEMAITAMVQDYAGSTGVLPAKDASSNYHGAGQASATTIGVGAGDQAAVGASTTMTWTVPNNGGLAIVGVSLRPSTASFLGGCLVKN